MQAALQERKEITAMSLLQELPQKKKYLQVVGIIIIPADRSMEGLFR